MCKGTEPRIIFWEIITGRYKGKRKGGILDCGMKHGIKDWGWEKKEVS